LQQKQKSKFACYRIAREIFIGSLEPCSSMLDKHSASEHLDVELLDDPESSTCYEELETVCFKSSLKTRHLSFITHLMKEQIALQHALKSRLESLRIRFPAYSMRAFAKRAGISPATMSLIIQGKRPVSIKLAESLSERLQFDPQERSEVLAKTLEPKDDDTREAYVQLTLDQYRIVSDWRSFAILNLIKTIDFQSNPRWIAERIGISEPDVNEIIERLTRLEMLKIENGKFVRTVSKYRTTEDIANASLKKSHAQNLELAHVALEENAVDERDFTWLTIPMDMDKMKLAKAMIRKFQDDLSEALETDAAPTEVYRMAVQLFPLSKLNKDPK
jgi:uncharacterized protein (TIGR02147 family)